MSTSFNDSDEHETLTDELHDALGVVGFLVLTEVYGGLRLFVPNDNLRSALGEQIGEDNARRLAKLYGGSYIRVPLAREFRARIYRNAGAKNGEIARKLGLTETGVEKLFRRSEKKLGGKGQKKDPRQFEMF